MILDLIRMNVLVVIKVHMKYTNSDFTFIGVATSLRRKIKEEIKSL